MNVKIFTQLNPRKECYEKQKRLQRSDIQTAGELDCALPVRILSRGRALLGCTVFLRSLEAKWGDLAVSHKGTPMVVKPQVEKAIPHIQIILDEIKKVKEALGVD